MIKMLLLSLLLSSSIALAEQLNTPRETMQTYLKAMVRIKSNTGDIEQNYKTAISALKIDSSKDVGFYEAKKYADRLIRVMDKIKKVDYNSIPNSENSAQWFFDKRLYQDKELEISISKFENSWFFTPKTFKSLADYNALLSRSLNVSGVTALSKLSDKIRNKLPDSMLSRSFMLENWQWPGIIIIILLAFIFEVLLKHTVSFLLHHYSKVIQNSRSNKLKGAIRPLSKIGFAYVLMKLTPILDFSIKTNMFIERCLIIIISFMSVWLCHKIIDLLKSIFTEKALLTDTKFDDILIPLITKTAYIIVYIVGALFILHSFTIDVTNLIAGLGIGGLAFAFAAKDTLANFFGSIMLVLDRPFDIGDIITAGGIEGVVDEVGFRSTRIRTFDDSVITISNGQIMNMAIDNKGKRRFRRLSTMLGVEYDTPPEKIEAFCEGIRQLILEHKWTKKDSFHVYFLNFGPSSLDIQIKVSWDTSDYARELAERHRLLIDILRLSKELQISFAFPTQTLHLFNEDKSEASIVPDKYFEAGIEKAKEVLKKPITLKNPRSNAEDKEQFGENDIGL